MSDGLKAEINSVLDEGLYKCQSDVGASKRLVAIYKKVYGVEICETCPGKVSEAYNQLQKLLTDNKNFIPMADRKYKLEGVVIEVRDPELQAKGVPETVSEANMTDEHAEIMLAKNPERYGQFIKKTEPSAAQDEGNSFKQAFEGQVSAEVLQSGEQIDSTMNKQQVMDELTAAGAEFKPSENKASMIQKLLTVRASKTQVK